MPTDVTDYVIAPWGDDSVETDICTIELPSRELIVQVEVPSELLERMGELGDEHGISADQALAERLELNRAQISLLSARAADEVTSVRSHLADARGYLSGVQALSTEKIEHEIDQVWQRELESTN